VNIFGIYKLKHNSKQFFCFVFDSTPENQDGPELISPFKIKIILIIIKKTLIHIYLFLHAILYTFFIDHTNSIVKYERLKHRLTTLLTVFCLKRHCKGLVMTDTRIYYSPMVSIIIIRSHLGIQTRDIIRWS